MKTFIFKHPFTAYVSGPTSCGKTQLVKTILEYCSSLITPPPHTIIWLYKRWQPLYDSIITTVFPKVQFIQGIPSNLDQDTFVNPKHRNLVILDDLMSTSSKDPRINELFTEGSHHRNLSVISINQNLYYNKDPTQRRNCHYVILFNNPIDKQQIMTLSRQMYPDNSNHLMKHFKEGTSKPYGYLLIDLKPFTPENKRLRCNPFQHVTDPPMKMEHSTHTPQVNMNQSIPFKKGPPHQSLMDPEPIKTCSDKVHHSCVYCGLLFQSLIQANHHMMRNCDEYRKRLLKEEDLSEIPTFQKLAKRARTNNEGKYNDLVDEFLEDGLSEKRAEKKAEKEQIDLDYNIFIKLYKQLMTYIIGLQDSDLHDDMLTEIIDLVDKGRSIKSAINRVVKREYFDELFEEDSSDSESETEEESDISDENEADNSQDNKDSGFESEDNIPLSQLQQ